ncbi:hypothetical protein JCM19297_2291 [Nonlabens ulvanivorans]|nr:hypothetical protein JCM19297_2291 [Nonlabens ulvanivorans]
MKIAVMTSLLTKWNVDINAAHLVKVSNSHKKAARYELLF